ncbi:MAG: hypothetical protein HZB65_00080 [Candidatus Aenigmarchaeota archaeon]|nr:hypothetical protein [Candidatus Aenigmarchaeota archaeon]
MSGYENLTLGEWEALSINERHKITKMFIKKYRNDIDKITGGASETLKTYVFGCVVGGLCLFASYEGVVDDKEINRVEVERGVPCFIVSTGLPIETGIEISDLYDRW